MPFSEKSRFQSDQILIRYNEPCSEAFLAAARSNDERLKQRPFSLGTAEHPLSFWRIVDAKLERKHVHPYLITMLPWEVSRSSADLVIDLVPEGIF